jgi:phage head maturation protease
MDNNFNLFIPFSKKDKKQKMVFGYASTEAIDSQGEIVEKKAIEEALPDYMRFANIREMHQPSAVGKTKQANIDGKGLFIGAKVVDPLAWEKVQEGVYSAFSIGGKKLAMVGNKIKKLVLSEISLVDRPANPEATFSMVKFDKAGVAIDVPGVKPMSDKEQKEKEQMMDMFDASYILNLAKELAYLVMTYKSMKKPTKTLENAIKNLKQAAKDNLGKADYFAVETLLNKAIEVSDTNDDHYAHIDASGNKRLPVDSKVNTMKSLALFARIKFESEEIETRVAKKLLEAVEKFGIRISHNSIVARSARQETGSPSPLFAQEWENDYFKQQRRVLG